MKTAPTFSDTIKWYDDHAQDFSDRIEAYDDHTLQDKFCSMIPKGGTILDAGCSSGRDTSYFASKGFTVFGVDYSKELISIAQQKHPHLTFYHQDFRSMDVPADHVDAIWAHASLVHLDHIRDIESTLQEFYRVLKNHGILHVSIKASEKHPDRERHFIYLKPEALQQLLRTAGFKLLESISTRQSTTRPDLQWLISFSCKTERS